MDTLRTAHLGRPTRAGILMSLCQSLWLALALALSAAAQNGVPYQPSQASPQFKVPAGTSATEFDTPEQAQEQQRIRALNAARQKSMVSDTNKLLRLVNELNAEIARNNADTLTSEQLRKIGTIEKLARNVKEKMSIPIVGLEPYQQPPPLKR